MPGCFQELPRLARLLESSLDQLAVEVLLVAFGFGFAVTENDELHQEGLNSKHKISNEEEVVRRANIVLCDFRYESLSSGARAITSIPSGDTRSVMRW